MSFARKTALICAFACVSMLAIAQESVQICSGRASVQVDQLYYDGSNVVADYSITLAPNVVVSCGCKSNESIVLTPALVNTKTGEKEVLEVIVINGQNAKCYSEWLDERCKAVTPNVRYFTAEEWNSLTVDSKYDVAHKDWMTPDTYLVVTAQKMIYPHCLLRLCQDKVAPVQFGVNPVWAQVELGEINPAKDLKTRMYFPVNVVNSVENYFENAAAIAILETLDSPNFDVTNIKIEGWASPEGTVAYNQGLSTKRAATMKKIVSDKYSFSDNLYDVKGNGEYWDGVYNYINNSTNEDLKAWAEKNADAKDLDAKEASLRKAAGQKVYQDIRNNVYPRSRFSDLTVSYRLKEATREDLMVLYRVNPAETSEDVYGVIVYDGDKVDEAVLKDALKYYPNSEVVNAAAAKCAVDKGDYKKAVEYYLKAGDSKEVANNLAACYIMMGNKAEAEKALAKAKGIDEYNVNVKEVKKLR